MSAIALKPQQQAADAQWLASHCLEHEPEAIASAVSRLVASGQLAPGTRLPTLRSLAPWLSVSQGTLAAAWGILRRQGVVVTRRRGGTVVATQRLESVRPLPRRPSLMLDLSRGLPDPALLPSLEGALLAGLRLSERTTAEPEAILPALLEVVSASWPFAAQDWIIGGGSSESLLLALQGMARRGDLVAIEEPTQPRLLAVLELLGMRSVGVACDAQGPIPQALAAVLPSAPAAFVLQQTAQIPLGFTLAEARMTALADVLADAPGVKIVEDDWIGPIGSIRPASLGARHPDRTVVVRSFCKAFGLELRSSIIGGSAGIVAAIRREKAHGLGTTSRILQGALHHLLTDPASVAAVAAARTAYARRRDSLAGALLARGHEIGPAQDGLFVRVPVADEAAALLALAERGLIAAPGSRSFIGTPGQAHLRVAITRLPEDDGSADSVADAIVQATSRRYPANFD